MTLQSKFQGWFIDYLEFRHNQIVIIIFFSFSECCVRECASLEMHNSSTNMFSHVHLYSPDFTHFHTMPQRLYGMYDNRQSLSKSRKNYKSDQYFYMFKGPNQSVLGHDSTVCTSCRRWQTQKHNTALFLPFWHHTPTRLLLENTV